MLVDQKKLDLYVHKNFNVLFEGERGVGKTSIIFNTFNKAKLRVKYFSAPTMDPWTDLVGVPSTITREDGKEVLRLIPPEEFVDNQYDVIFIDELNRAPKKVMNALMELMQFKTINGRPYNIKMIWAAINPHTEKEEYHVEPLDKAVEDRFQIKIKMPYKVDESLFKEKFGTVGEIFANWWKNQPEAVQKEISPRRLYDATDFHIDGGDFTDMINVGNTQKLKEDLKSVSQILVLESAYQDKNINRAKSVLEKNYSKNVEGFLLKNKSVFQFFIPLINEEWLAKSFISNNKAFKYMNDIVEDNNSSEEKNKVVQIITDIVNINKKSYFVKQNEEKLSAFMTDETKELYKNTTTADGDLFSTSKIENKFISLINDRKFNLGGVTSLTASSVSSHFTWNNIITMVNFANNYIKKGELDIERSRLQLSKRIAFILVYLDEASLTTQKIITSLTNSSHSSYVWGKNNMPDTFKDLGVEISSHLESLRLMSKDEIKAYYLETTSKNKIKNKRLGV